MCVSSPLHGLAAPGFSSISSMGWLRQKLKQGPPFVDWRVNIGIRSAIVGGLVGLYAYSKLVEPPPIWYSVRAARRRRAAKEGARNPSP